jgi:hypothetical protein
MTTIKETGVARRWQTFNVVGGLISRNQAGHVDLIRARCGAYIHLRPRRSPLDMVARGAQFRARRITRLRRGGYPASLRKP